MEAGAHFLGEATWRLQVASPSFHLDVRGSRIYQSHRHSGLDADLTSLISARG